MTRLSTVEGAARPSVRPVALLSEQPRDGAQSGDEQGLDDAVADEVRDAARLRGGVAGALARIEALAAVLGERAVAAAVAEPRRAEQEAKLRQHHADGVERVVDEQRAARLQARSPALDVGLGERIPVR